MVERGAHPLVVPVADLGDSETEKGSDESERHADWNTTRRPLGRRPADQRQSDRCGDQQPGEVADPPGSPGVDKSAVGDKTRGAQRRRRHACRDEAADRACCDEAGDVDGQGEGQRLAHQALHQRRADARLQGGADGDDRRHDKGDQIAVAARRQECRVDQKRSQRDGADHARAEGEHARQGNTRGWIEGRRVPGRNGQEQGRHSGGDIGERRQRKRQAPAVPGIVPCERRLECGEEWHQRAWPARRLVGTGRRTITGGRLKIAVFRRAMPIDGGPCTGLRACEFLIRRCARRASGFGRSCCRRVDEWRCRCS